MRPAATSSLLGLDARTVPKPRPQSGLDPLEHLSEPERDALAGEHVGDQRPRVRVVAREQPLGGVDEGHPRPHAREHLRQLAPDRPAAETISRSGTSCVEVASRLVQNSTPSSPWIGGIDGTDPVAISSRP